MLKPRRIAAAFPNESISDSPVIQSGIDTGNLTRSRRIADKIWARLWLAQGFPIADVLTMLEVRRRFEFSPHFARTYAVEILSAVRTEIQLANQPPTAHREESYHAVA
jgi:hypothetical protein